MGAMKRAPASRRPPRRGAGGGSPASDGGGDGGGGRGRPGDGKGKAAEANGRPARSGEREHDTGVTPRGQGGSGSSDVFGGSGAGGRGLRGSGKHDSAAELEAAANEEGRPFSGLLVLCTDFTLTSSEVTEQILKVYKEKVEALGGIFGSGFQYNEATHIAVMGEIPPGARIFWEGESKRVTKINWIDECYKERKLLPIEAKERYENLISQPNEMTPVSNKSSERKCISTNSKELRYATRDKSRTPRRLDFSGYRSVYHRHLSCDAENELTEQVYDYALRYRMHEFCALPGCFETICCEEGMEVMVPKSVKVCRLTAKVIVMRCFTRLASMHADRFSLGGKFSSKNFLIYADDSIKLHGLADGAILAYSDENGNLDYTQFVKMITGDVFFDQKLPFDLTEWLRIISQGVRACSSILLCNHVDLMEPYQAYGHFVCMYTRFSGMSEEHLVGQTYWVR